MRKAVILEEHGWTAGTPVAHATFPVTASEFCSSQEELNMNLTIGYIINSQFSWARNPQWSQFNSGGPEIWQYLKDVALKYDLEKYVKLSHRVDSATWDDSQGVWKLSIQAPDGSFFADQCEILANCSGVLK
jgi:cation diffusion facilitator CzcD-associated flavoprotein CzcO